MATTYDTFADCSGSSTAIIQANVLEAFFEGSLNAIALLDRELRFTRVSRSFAAATGRVSAQLIGRRYADVCPSSAELLLQEAMRTRKPASADALAFEPANDLRACSNQGHGKTFWDFKVVPVLDDFDEVDVLMLCISDVTQHKRTEHRLQQAMTKLRRLSQQLVNFQERERHRVARELHDDIGQSLIGLKLMLANVIERSCGCAGERLEEARAMSSKLIHSVRNIAHDLRPSMLDDLGLLSALFGLVDGYRTHRNINIHVRHHGVQHRLRPEVETAAFRIIQESLVNVAKHAGVADANVELFLEDGALWITVSDRGAGFEKHRKQQPRSGLGLIGMAERAHLLGGEFHVRSALGRGTTIKARLPGATV